MAYDFAFKPLYIAVADDASEEKPAASFRYTRSVLQSTLQLMGCKARHAFKISRRVFELIWSESTCDHFSSEEGEAVGSDVYKVDGSVVEHEDEKSCSKVQDVSDIPFEVYKKRTTIFVCRKTFLNAVCDVLAEYKYVGPNQRADLVLACRIKEKKESVTVLLCGTSGCGKSTLSALLGSRLGITTVISTDSIRHMMRSFADEKQNPLLWASTYHAGECLDPLAVAEAKTKRKAKKQSGNMKSHPLDDADHPKQTADYSEFISPKQMAVEGFKAQSEMVIDSLDRLITAWEERKESVVVEGVHLSLNFVMGLMRKHPSIIPFMIYISSEDKHLERFAVRAKYMTLDPAKNKYVKYIRNIRTIQDYLCKQADKHLVPKINNTNVDKSVAAIHATVFSCLRRRDAGEQLYDPMTNTVSVLDEEYRNQCTANSLSSKGMFQLIQRKGSSRHLMALLNTDGSVAKAWPLDSKNIDQNHMYEHLQIFKAEPVNLQFGNFGLSAWPSDGGTSYAGSVDESRAETETGSRYISSCCSSPRMSDAPSKELKEESSVHESDEEVDDLPEPDSDEDAVENGIGDDNALEIGSVDEEFTKSDEEFDDLAMQDVHENGYWSDDEDVAKRNKTSAFVDRSRNATSEPMCSYSSFLIDKGENSKARRRSHTKHSPVMDGPIVSGAP